MKVFAKDCLKVIRIKNGFSISDLADSVGISKQMMGQVENRKNGISPSNASKVIEFLGVEFDDVFELVERGSE